jgi:hypothetical protein
MTVPWDLVGFLRLASGSTSPEARLLSDNQLGDQREKPCIRQR